MRIEWEIDKQADKHQKVNEGCFDRKRKEEIKENANMDEIFLHFCKVKKKGKWDKLHSMAEKLR